MKKGFTLIELLAVIAIIAIVALVTTPIVIGLIQSSRESAFMDTAHSLVLAAGRYQAERQRSNESTYLYIDYKDGTEESKNVLKVTGDLPSAGEFEALENGKVRFALWSDEAHICVVKSISGKTVTVSESIKRPEDCLIKNIGE